MLALG
jgi:hypothetical protein